MLFLKLKEEGRVEEEIKNKQEFHLLPGFNKPRLLQRQSNPLTEGHGGALACTNVCTT